MNDAVDPSGSFHRRTLVWGLPIIAISLLATLVAMVLGPEIFEPVVASPSTYSRSAIGHQAFSQLLESLDYPVEISRSRSGEKARDQGLLIIAEPEPWESEEDEPRFGFLSDLIAERTLLILPKRRGVPIGRSIQSESPVGRWRIEDLGTLNGIWIGVKEQRLDMTVQVQMGEQRFKIRFP